MHFPFLHHVRSNAEEPPPVVNHEPESFSMEGSEFLDDAIRMEDLMPVRTEEIVAAGSPGNLL